VCECECVSVSESVCVSVWCVCVCALFTNPASIIRHITVPAASAA